MACRYPTAQNTLGRPLAADTGRSSRVDVRMDFLATLGGNIAPDYGQGLHKVYFSI